MAEEERTVYARIPYVSDKEIHVSTVQSPHDGEFFEAREFIPSLNVYGRGLTFPLAMLDQYLAGVEAVWHARGAEIQDGKDG